MSIFDSWEKWSLTQWLGWGSKLQSKYDKYRNLKTPEWYLNLTESIWDKLNDAHKAFLNNFIEETVKYFGEDFARELVEKVVNAIKKKMGWK